MKNFIIDFYSILKTQIFELNRLNDRLQKYILKKNYINVSWFNELYELIKKIVEAFLQILNLSLEENEKERIILLILICIFFCLGYCLGYLLLKSIKIFAKNPEFLNKVLFFMLGLSIFFALVWLFKYFQIDYYFNLFFNHILEQLFLKIIQFVKNLNINLKNEDEDNKDLDILITFLAFILWAQYKIYKKLQNIEENLKDVNKQIIQKEINKLKKK